MPLRYMATSCALSVRSAEGLEWLNNRFQAALIAHGKVPQADIERIAKMSLVLGTVTDLGRPYADGAQNLEIRTLVVKATGLPYENEQRKEIRLRIAGVTYDAGIRATQRNAYV